MAAAAAREAAPPADGVNIFLPEVSGVLRRWHVEAELKKLPDDARNVTVWVHNSTLGMEELCFTTNYDEVCDCPLVAWGLPTLCKQQCGRKFGAVTCCTNDRG
jgi:hypothetical protein